MKHSTPDRRILHRWALTGAARVALHKGSSAFAALTREEVRMVLRTAALFGREMEEDAALRLLTDGTLGFTLTTDPFDTTPPLTRTERTVTAFITLQVAGNGAWSYFEAREQGSEKVNGEE